MDRLPDTIFPAPFFSAQQLRAALGNCLPQGRLEVVDVIPSTNVRARELAEEGAPHGSVVIADGQSAGHGRLGRVFDSCAGAGLYLSLLLRGPIPPAAARLLTVCAATATAAAIEEVTGISPAIKWVNDLLIGGRKCCGILTEGEADMRDGGMTYAVVGVGINVAARRFPAPLDTVATTLEDACGHPVSRLQLAAALLRRLEHLPAVAAEGVPEAYRTRSAVLGRDITVRTATGEEAYAAHALAINDGGGLVVQLPDGTRRVLRAEEVSIRTK